MELQFKVMTRQIASQVAKWKYDSPYDVYGRTEDDLEQAIEYLTDPKNCTYAVLHQGELIGFRSYGADGRVKGGSYDESYLDTGGGIRPDLPGKKLGPEIIKQGLRFGSRQFRTNRFRVTIADFNERAQKACEKIGFLVSDRFLRSSDQQPFTIFTIELETKLTTLERMNLRPTWNGSLALPKP